MRKFWLPLLVSLGAVLFFSCSSTRHLPENQYMLMRNNVEVVDAKSPDFDDLKTYVRPLPNKRFMDIFNVKTMVYSAGCPRMNRRSGEEKDTRFKQWLRRKGEAPVLLDSAEIENSVSQLQLIMGQLGYFDAEVDYAVRFHGVRDNKAKVNYSVTAKDAYTVSKISYDIDIPEYKKIVVLNMDETLLTPGMRYKESAVKDEITRIINLIKDEGYYYVEKSVLRCEVTYDPPVDSAQTDPKTISLKIILKIPNQGNSSRYLYKYYFNDVFVQTNYNFATDAKLPYDTVLIIPKQKWDTTHYYFITPHYDYLDAPLVDYHYKTITDAIFSQRGERYSQTARRQSSQALNQLGNFDYISILYQEDESKLDTVNRIGYLNTTYLLTRKKVHSVGGQVDLRNDKSALSFTYTNKNIFKGAEMLTLNASAGYFYYSLSNLFHKDRTYAYPEFGVTASLHFPKLFLFNRHQKREYIKAFTSLNFGVNYSGLYHRLIFNSALTYNWTQNYYVNQSLSPLDLSTINNNDKRHTQIMNFSDYQESYQRKFGKFLLLSLKYNFNFLVPFSVEKQHHNMRISVNAESSGLFLKGLNMLCAPKRRWVLIRNSLDSTGYDYTTFEKMEFTWNYTYKINDNNALSTRMNAGAIIPLGPDSEVPYEKGFYMGTSNSMRGWSYRGLGPGSYEHQQDSLFTGDIKFEWNIEYRGTIYRTFKYGVFCDIGNIWLAKKNADMPGADFSFTRFYKELAVDVGVGLRLDFDFFVIRVDYALPIYDPTRSRQGRWINAQWQESPHRFRLRDGLKIAIGYAF